MTAKNSEKKITRTVSTESAARSNLMNYLLYLSLSFSSHLLVLEGVQVGAPRLNSHLVWPYGKIDYKNKCLYTAYD